MIQTIIVAIVYIILFALEILAYYISKKNEVFLYGLITLIAFIITFGTTLTDW